MVWKWKQSIGIALSNSRWEFYKNLFRPCSVSGLKTTQLTLFLLFECYNCFQTRHQHLTASQFSEQLCWLSITYIKSSRQFPAIFGSTERINSVGLNWARGMQFSQIFSHTSDTVPLVGYNYCSQIIGNTLRWVLLGLSQNGICSNIFENLSVNSLKRDLPIGKFFIMFLLVDVDGTIRFRNRKNISRLRIQEAKKHTDLARPHCYSILVPCFANCTKTAGTGRGRGLYPRKSGSEERQIFMHSAHIGWGGGTLFFIRWE